MCWKTTLHLTRLIALATTLTLWSIPAQSQKQLERATRNIDITAGVGFQQRVQLDKWNPITVTVRNAGAALTGYLEIIAADSRNRIDYQTHYRQPIELARDAQKRLQFTIFISRITEPLHIRVVTAAGEVASHRIELRSRLSQQRFIVALGKDINLDYLNDRTSHRAQVVYPLPGFLPAHWQGYDGVEAVVLHRFALSTLAPRQYSALTKWISAGGTLLVSGGYDTAILRTPRIAELLPARVTGTQQLDTRADFHTALGSVAGAAPENTLGDTLDDAPTDPEQALILTGPLGIASVDSKGMNTVHHIDDIPLVLKHSYGLGSVVFLTLDLASKPFQSWSGMRRFMYRMLQLSEVKPVTLTDQQGTDQALTPLLTRLTRQRAVDYPDHATVFVFTVFYLVVLALYIRQSDTRQNDSASDSNLWKTLLAFAVPVVFSVGAIGLFHRLLFPQLPSLSSVAVLEPIDNSSLARLQLELISHATRAHPLAIQYSGANPVLRTAATPLLSNRPYTVDQDSTIAAWIFNQSNATGAQPLEPDPYTVFRAHGSDIIDFAVNGNYQADGSLEFRNTSGRTITDLWAITHDSVFDLGAVTDGESLNTQLTAGMPLARFEWRDKLQDLHDGSSVPVAAVEAILDGSFDTQFSQHSDTSVLLIGFTSNPWKIDNANWNHIDLTIMAWRIHQRGSQQQGLQP